VTQKHVEATLAADGTAQLDWRTDVSGVSASSWRARYHAEATRKQRVQEDLGAEFTGLELATIDAGNLEDLEKPVSMRAHGKVAQFARNEGDTISVPVGPAEHMVREFASLGARKQDIRLYAQSTTESDWTVKLPAGAKVLRAPQGDSVESPFGTFSLSVEKNGATVHVKSSLTIKTLRVRASDYPQFRAFCERVDAILGQRLAIATRGGV
jgi:hypothetical protein